MTGLSLLSQLLGWTYVLCWSISFYPQLLLNIRLKSSDGVSIDFLYLNTLGYVTYLTSLCLQVYNEKVRSQFYQRFGDYPLLSFIDIVYAGHGLVLNLIIASQLYIWNYTRASNGRIHSYTRNFFYIFAFTVAAQLMLIHYDKIQLVDFAINLAYTKIIISFLKYIPQLLHNYKRQSCHGFSILQIWLDFSGGSFAVLQLFLDNYIDNDKNFKWSEIAHNKGKLGLSLVTFFFDFCFIIQYYVVYKEHLEGGSKAIGDERRPSTESLIPEQRV